MTITLPKPLASQSGARLPKGKRTNYFLSLEENLSYRLSMLSFLVGKATAEIYGAEQMTSHQWKVMSVLCHFAPLRASEIERLVTLDKSAISRTVQKLLASKLIERQLAGSDARSAHIIPTNKGERLHSRVAAKITEMQASLLTDVPEPEVQSLFRTFRQLETRLLDKFARGEAV